MRHWIGRRRRALTAAAVVLLLGAGGCAILTLPLTTLQGVDYTVTAYRIPAYVKVIDFLQRHFQYQLLASRICEGKVADVDCVLAIFNWTHETIRPTPDGSTVVDDHVTNIVIRRHGTSDQIADVFVTLTGYAGVPAVSKWLSHDRAGLVVAFARLGDRWVMFDVERGLVFRDRRGDLADVDTLIADAALVDEQARGELIKGQRYSSFITAQALLPVAAPGPRRADMQQPWARVRYELRRVVGFE